MALLRYDFKKRLNERFPSGERLRTTSLTLFPVYFGFATKDDAPFADDSVVPDVANISKFLHHFAEMHLGEAPIYNAAKHGLSVVGGERGLKVENDQGTFDSKVLSLAAFDLTKGKLTRVRRRTISVERDIAFTVVATDLMRQLWDVARTRYTRAPLHRLSMFEVPTFASVFKIGRAASGFDRARFPLDSLPLRMLRMSRKRRLTTISPRTDLLRPMAERLLRKHEDGGQDANELTGDEQARDRAQGCD